MPTLNQIRVFYVTARELHFRRAAQILNVAQPALTRSIRLLEQEVGARLFDRTSRLVRLTPTGQVFFDECCTILSQLDVSMRRTQSAATGNAGFLSIAYTDFCMFGFLPAIITGFRRRYPDVQFQLTDMPTPIQKTALLEGRIDIGFLTGPLISDQLQSRLVNREAFLALLPHGHPLAEKQSLGLGDLAEVPFVMGSRESWTPFRQIIDNLCLEHGFLPRVTQEANNSIGIFGLVSANIGATLYPRCAETWFDRQISFCELADTQAALETVAAWSKRNNSKVLARFVEFLSETIPDQSPA